jgi:hypothetical protein
MEKWQQNMTDIEYLVKIYVEFFRKQSWINYGGQVWK